jgi:hypothetical protein
MKKLAAIPIGLLVVLTGILSRVSAQNPQQIEVVLSKTTAAQNEVVYADVYVRSSLTIVGADVGIEVDQPCLKVDGRENGHYLPTTAETNGFVPFEKTTETGTRLAASVLGQQTVADPSQYFFRALLRVVCDKGSANVKVTFAQLVDKQLTSYKLAAGQIASINALLIISGPPAPTTSAGTVQPTQPAPGGGGQPGSIDLRIVLVIGVVLVILVIVVIALRVQVRRPR